MNISMTKTSQIKKAGTKTVFLTTKVETENITEEQYNNIIESASFFRRLGGSCYQPKAYTCRGYKVYKDVLTSPDKQTKTIREFTFS